MLVSVVSALLHDIWLASNLVKEVAGLVPPGEYALPCKVADHHWHCPD
jgi:hypothetical protein